MSLGIYKPGQGYWVRVMTAGLIAIITIAAAAWLWNQASLVAEKLPKAGWSLDLKSVPADVKPGAAVTLFGAALEGITPPTLGTATVSDLTGQTVLVKDLNLVAKADPTQIHSLTAGQSPSAEALRTAVSRRAALPLIEPTLFSGLVAAVVIIIGAIIGYYLVGVRAATVEFLIATDFEMKRVNWSTPREIMGSTYVVIFACVFVTLSLFLFDRLYENIFKLIGVLPR